MTRELYLILIVLVLSGCSQKKQVSVSKCDYRKNQQKKMNLMESTCDKKLGNYEYKECVYEFNKMKKLEELKNRIETFNKCSKQHLEDSGTY